MKVPDDFGVCDADLAEAVIPNTLRDAKQVEDRILEELARHAYDTDASFAIKLSIEEALTNAVRHGNKNDPSKRIVIRHYVDDARAVIAVRDEGDGFCPATVPDPTVEENLERPNGRGLMLMQSYMTKVCFNTTGNEVWMLKERTTATPPQAVENSGNP
ncbi:MAG: ATP-binding protein [Planctomycetes bacterium]|nr:ATP-binding protein [Planctomycetota bacterium]